MMKKIKSSICLKRYHRCLAFQTISIILIIISIIIDQTSFVYSMGTLLHAGPSCLIKPLNRIGQGKFVDYGSSTNLIKHRGICYSNLLCKQKGGVAIGKCGLINSCCVFPQTCNSISVRNSTYFTSPDYPSMINRTSSLNYELNTLDHRDQLSSINDDDQCLLTIHRMPGIYPICQIRLDFIEYEIEGLTLSEMNDDNDCHTTDQKTLDWIFINAKRNEENQPLSSLCPTSKIGQYVLIDIRKHIGPFSLMVNFGSFVGRRRWNILINQIECSRSYSAQYSPQPEILNSIES